jgi:hypothetical protein
MGDRIVSGAFLDPPGSIHYLGPDLAICGGAVASEPLPEEMGKASRGKRSKAAAESSDMEALERKVLLTELRARQVEAEIRYLKANAERRQLKGTKSDLRKARREQRKANAADDTDDDSDIDTEE